MCRSVNPVLARRSGSSYSIPEGVGKKFCTSPVGQLRFFLLLSVSVLSASWIQIGVFVVFYFSVHIGFCSRSHSGLEFRIDNAA